MPKLSLCLIVKADDKEAFYLDRCLNSVYQYVDEICITITGKKGESKEVERICKKYKARISYFKWIDDFATARNFNFSQAKGEYVFWLDADDVCRGAENLPQVIKKMEEEVIDGIIMDYLYDWDEFKQCIVKHRKVRIIRNDGCFKWQGAIHEDLIPQREVNSFFVKGIQILHLSAPTRYEDSKKRNLRIALKQLNNNPSDPKNYWDVANAYLSLGNNKEAIKYYQKFIKRSGSEIERLTAYHRMAGAYMALGKIDEAIKCEMKVIEIRPWFPDGYLGLGEIFHKQGKYKHAKEFLIQGLAKDIPEDEYIVWNPRDYDFNPLMLLADCYFNLAKPKEAKKCLEGCLKIYPNHPRVKTLIKKLDEEIKKLDEVDKIVERGKNLNKKELKKLLDSLPHELKSHPKICWLRNINFIKKKSSGRDLVIYCFPTAENFNPEIVMKEGRGGSEEAVVHMSKRLADLGWNVTVYASCGYKVQKFGKVWWKPYWEFNIRDKQDVVIAWRHPLLFDYEEVNATQRYVWLHDVLKENDFTPRRLERITKIFALSKAQRDLFPNIPDEKFFITKNGIEPEQFKKKIERNPYRLIYTSSPDRGLKTLLKDIFPYIKKEVPKAELHVFYGWHVWDAMYKDDPVMMKEKEEIMKLMNQPGVIYHGRVSQEQIVEEYMKSSVWIYPTEFFEISCISAIKAQAAGCIPVTTNVAALNETVQFGLKVDSQHIYSDIDAQKEIIETTINLLKNSPAEKEREPMKKWALREYDWDKIARDWDKLFKKNGKGNRT